MTAYLLISRLLQYPTRDLIDLVDDIDVACSELTDEQQKTSIKRFIQYLKQEPLHQLQTNYVSTFDFNKRVSLHMSFHGLGDRRERGMAMLNLKQRYRAAGFELDNSELPDYLPVVLEFCAEAPAEFVTDLFEEFRPPLELIRAALKDEDSPYHELFDAVLAGQPKLTEDQIETILARAAEGPPTESVGLEPFSLEKTDVVGIEPNLTGAGK